MYSYSFLLGRALLFYHYLSILSLKEQWGKDHYAVALAVGVDVYVYGYFVAGTLQDDNSDENAFG